MAHVIALCNLAKSGSLTLPELRKLSSNGAGDAIWDRLKSVFSVATDSRDTWWASVTTRLEPGSVKGSRWSLKGGVELNLKARKLWKSDVCPATMTIMASFDLDEFQFPESGNISDQYSQMDNLFSSFQGMSGTLAGGWTSWILTSSTQEMPQMRSC